MWLDELWKRWGVRTSRQLRRHRLARRSSSRKQRRVLLNLEPLEDRVTPSTTITVTDTSGGMDQAANVALSTVNTSNNVTLIDAINIANNTGNSSGPYTIVLPANQTITFAQPLNNTTITKNNVVQDQQWYGPDALPAISSAITIKGNGATLQIASGTTERFFYVSGGPALTGGALALGTLELDDLTLQGGTAQGGEGANGVGSGGLGAGGAIFNQGNLTLNSDTLTDNKAIGGLGGGSGSPAFTGGGGGMGGNANGSAGGGFGGNFSLPGGPEGGAGASDGGGGGGAGFQTKGGSTSSTSGGAGGGLGGFGGAGDGPSGGAAGDGGGGGGGFGGGGGGGFGRGGSGGDGGGGGGIGGGGGADGGGFGGAGGFGGGGGVSLGGAGGSGGFGGGGVAYLSVGGGGFGGGNFVAGGGGGGGGMGGGIFSMFGSLIVANSTLSGNSAQGGNGSGSGGGGWHGFGGDGGSGYGGAIFNLDGTATLTYATIANNSVTAGTGGFGGSSGNADGGGVYNLAYGSVPATGDPVSALTTIEDSILAGSTGGNDLVNNEDTSKNAGDTTTVTFADNNIVGTQSNTGGTIGGTTPSTANPLLASLSNYGGPEETMSLLPGSPAIGMATPVNGITTDERGVTRSTSAPDLGAFESQGFNLSVTGGNNQNTLINTAFADPLVVTVTPVDGVDPVEGAQVTFTAPSSGASATLSPFNPVTIIGDTATVNATANGVPGSYQVTANMVGAPASAAFALTNQAAPILSVTDAGGPYTGNPYPATGTAVGIDGKTPVAGSFTYTYYSGSSPTGTPLSGAPINAGTYTVAATFTSADSNYTSGGTAQTTFTINATTPTLSVTDAGGTYNGNPFPATGSAVGVDGKTAVAGSFVYTYYSGSSPSGTPLPGAPSNAGTYTVVATFTSTDGNYTSGGTAQTTFTINATAPTISVTDAGGAYTGNPFSATGTALGLDGKTAVSGSFVYTYYSGSSPSGTPLPGAPSNAGTYTVVATFTSTDNNYTSGGTAQTTFTINATTPTLSVTDAGGTYNGNPFSATGSAVGIDDQSVSGTFSYSYYSGSSPTGTPSSDAPSNAGTYTVVATFTSTDNNYASGGTTQTTFTIKQAVPTLAVTDAGGTYNGNPFPASASAMGVDGKTAVAGSFSYTYYSGSSPSGMPLSDAPSNAGTYTVVATFTSTDNNYTSGGTAQTTFTINATTPTLSVTDAGGTFNGNPFPATGKAVGIDDQSVSGTFSYSYYSGSSPSGTPLSGAPSNAGTYTVVAIFTSTDSNYSGGGTAQTTFAINATTPTLSVTDAGGAYTGNPFPATGAAVGTDGKTPVSGSFVYTYYSGSSANGTPLSGAPSNAGTYTVAATFTSTNNNYTSGGTAKTTFTIKQASTTTTAGNVTITFSDSTQMVTLTAHVSSATAAVNEGTVTFTVLQGSTVIGTATTSDTVSNGTASVSYAVPGGRAAGTYTLDTAYNPGSDFLGSSTTAPTLTIAQAAATVQLTSVTLVPNYFALSQTETIAVHVSIPSGPLNGGTVAFTVGGQTVNASVDGSGNATANLTVPLLATAFSQSITTAYNGPNANGSTATTAYWTLIDALLFCVDTFAAASGQSVQSYIFGIPLLDYLYNSQGQLTEVIFGPNLFDWIFS